MTDETRYYVDSETFNKLSHANHELLGYLKSLLERKDLEAFSKLFPIGNQITDLLVAILEGAFPDISRAIDAINRLGNEIHERISQARTPGQIKQLSAEVDRLVADWGKGMDEVMAAAKRLEKQSRKQ